MSQVALESAAGEAKIEEQLAKDEDKPNEETPDKHNEGPHADVLLDKTNGDDLAADEVPDKTDEDALKDLEAYEEGDELLDHEGYEYEYDRNAFEYDGYEYEDVQHDAELPGEQVEIEEETEEEKSEEEEIEVKEVKEEEPEYEEPEIDPTAPLNLSDSVELRRLPWHLKPEQMEEIDMIWEMFQDHTYVYAELDNFITIKELRFMLKALLLMTYTEEQLQELVKFCVRPPDPQGKITYDQFVHICTMRWRDLSLEEELRLGLQGVDHDKTGIISEQYITKLMTRTNNKLPTEIVERFIKEVDFGGEGQISIEDIVGICAMDFQIDEALLAAAGATAQAEEIKEAAPTEDAESAESVNDGGNEADDDAGDDAEDEAEDDAESDAGGDED